MKFRMQSKYRLWHLGGFSLYCPKIEFLLRVALRAEASFFGVRSVQVAFAVVISLWKLLLLLQLDLWWFLVSLEGFNFTREWSWWWFSLTFKLLSLLALPPLLFIGLSWMKPYWSRLLHSHSIPFLVFPLSIIFILPQVFLLSVGYLFFL